MGIAKGGQAGGSGQGVHSGALPHTTVRLLKQSKGGKEGENHREKGKPKTSEEGTDSPNLRGGEALRAVGSKGGREKGGNIPAVEGKKKTSGHRGD